MILFFVLMMLFQLVSVAHSAEKLEKDILPVEIKEHYKNLNRANAFSTPAERAVLTKYIYSKDSSKSSISKREAFVLNLLKDVKRNEYVESNKMPNKLNSGRAPSSFLYVIQFGFKEHHFISVRLKKYQIGVVDNFKIINLYDEEKDSIILEEEIEKLTTPRYVSDEFHEWVFINDQWFKKEVKKVLAH